MPKGELKKASESELAAEIREAIGATPDEPVEVTTSQFERPPTEAKPGSPPEEDWDGLRGVGELGLREMGCRRWDEPDEAGMMLMLFPGEWYDAIPDGFEIVDICGETESFVPGETDDDIRFGCLAFGVKTRAEVTKI